MITLDFKKSIKYQLIFIGLNISVPFSYGNKGDYKGRNFPTSLHNTNVGLVI